MNRSIVDGVNGDANGLIDGALVDIGERAIEVERDNPNVIGEIVGDVELKALCDLLAWVGGEG